ncbi:hotdog fold thioesterase [Actinokineospora sp. UTMC 2448]|uniref:hotdog fold thioesterase n=1 Tax=Actinokineospora sp. UTMC 2448 TaxID=2268449 RepID=UPI0021641950|nr:hotdog fold thioesterase [Actinokineospora sp. UTMC 2448]UVS80325.1 Proofreading thioesterase EntH [Actinokineospora sp. UTMC 2448]
MSESSVPDWYPVREDLAGQLLEDRMGIKITEWDKDRLVATMPVAGNMQPYGLLHGGANGVLAETLGSVAGALHAPEGKTVVGLELSCTHHRAVRDGEVTGVCTPLHVGRSSSTFEIAIYDDTGRRTCTARLTCMVLDRAPGAR